MLSVVIETRNDEDPLARTLTSLVPGAVEGIVREVLVCDHGSTDRTHHVAEHAGCHFLTNGTAAAGIRQAKGEWVLLLEPGARMLDGWMEAVIAHVSASTGAARFVPSSRGSRLLARIMILRRPLSRGLLISRRQALSLGRADGSAAGLAKAVSARKLRAEILVAGPDRAP